MEIPTLHCFKEVMSWPIKTRVYRNGLKFLFLVGEEKERRKKAHCERDDAGDEASLNNKAKVWPLKTKHVPWRWVQSFLQFSYLPNKHLLIKSSFFAFYFKI